MNIKLEIQKMAKEIGISKIGFTTADDFDYLEKSLRLGVEEGRTTGFEHKNIEERIYPKLSLESAKTIISIAVAIRISCRNNLKKQNLSVAKSLQIHGA